MLGHHHDTSLQFECLEQRGTDFVHQTLIQPEPATGLQVTEWSFFANKQSNAMPRHTACVQQQNCQGCWRCCDYYSRRLVMAQVNNHDEQPHCHTNPTFVMANWQGRLCQALACCRRQSWNIVNAPEEVLGSRPLHREIRQKAPHVQSSYILLLKAKVYKCPERLQVPGCSTVIDG